MSGDNNNDKELLVRRGERRELIATVFGFIVGFGLLIEYGDEIFDCFAKRHLPSRQLFGGLLVTAGVFGEVLFARLALKTSRTLQERADSDVAKAEERTAVAERKIAELNLLAEQERLARVALEVRLGPRWINVRQVSEAMKAHTGIKFGIKVLGGDQECSQLATFIQVALSDAGWGLIGWEVVLPALGFPEGVVIHAKLVELDAKATDKTTLAAMALFNEFLPFAIDPSVQMIKASDSASGEIVVSVGLRKPYVRSGNDQPVTTAQA